MTVSPILTNLTDEEMDAAYGEAVWSIASRVRMVRSDSEGERSDDGRLFGTLCYALGASGGLLDARSITEMLDHKGTLTVTWRDRLSLIRFHRLIDRAWEDFGNECETIHAVGSRENAWSHDE